MKKGYFLIILLAIAGSLSGQQKISDPGLIRLLQLHDTLHSKLPIEKVYVQTDKPFYTVGDTIWLKAFVFNADYLTYSRRSGLLYIELDNDSAETVTRLMMPLAVGIGYGQIAIDGNDIPEGSYTLRAYTNWMRNFGEDDLFAKNIYIMGAGNKPWLVNIKAASSNVDGKRAIQTSLAFTGPDNLGVLLREMRVTVNDGNHNLFSGKTQTDITGMLNVSFPLSPKADAKNINLHVEDLRKNEGNRQMNIPIVLNRPENTDLQFMPEGGNFVAGIQSKMGFKAIGEDGRGVKVNGTIVNSKQETVASFTSLYKGIGSFMLNPQAGEHYTAKAILSNGETKTYPLPQVKNNGSAIAIENRPDDSLAVTVSITPDFQENIFYLTAKSREVICYARSVKFTAETARRFIIAKNLFPSGIARFSLLTRAGQPLNERIIYIDHHDRLKIAIIPDKPTYGARDSVALHIKVTDEAGKPVYGSFSMAVTDDSEVPIDTLEQNDLITSLLLTSDLKGTVEGPGYYANAAHSQALDNLMLTQGWTGYDWAKLTGILPTIKFEAERQFAVTGRVENILNKPVTGSQVILLSKKSAMPKIAKTNDKGEFVFTDFPVGDSALYFVEAKNKRGGNFGVGITINQPMPPQFNKPHVHYLPWFVNTDTTMKRSVGNMIAQRLEEDKQLGVHELKEVQIRDKKIVPGSFNLNGPGIADQVLDEKLMNKSGDMTLEELLEKNVKGFGQGYAYGRFCYMVGMRVLYIYIDGVNLKNYGDYNHTKEYMDNFTAKDIKGIEIMTSIKTRMAYNPDIIDSEILMAHPPMYIEITTRANVGPYKKNTPGTYVYWPVPFIVPKQFYAPKYKIKTPDGLKDLRSTIHWQPNIITDKQGLATVSFYASDGVGNYTITVEGSDMNGNIGSVTQKLTVK